MPTACIIPDCSDHARSRVLPLKHRLNSLSVLDSQYNERQKVSVGHRNSVTQWWVCRQCRPKFLFELCSSKGMMRNLWNMLSAFSNTARLALGLSQDVSLDLPSSE